jgi:hypothetical protein
MTPKVQRTTMSRDKAKKNRSRKSDFFICYIVDYSTTTRLVIVLLSALRAWIK